MTIKKSRYIPTRNYVIFGALIVGIVFVFLYAFGWYNVKQEEKYLESYLIKTNTVSQSIKTLDELDNILTENAINYFIFTGFTGSEEEYKFEEELKPLIDDYNISSIFYYFDVTELMDDENFLKDFSDLIGTSVSNLPTVIYFENSEYQNKIINENDKMLTGEDFEILLEIYGYEKSK